MSRAIFLFVLATVLAFGVVVASVGHGRTVPALTQARVYQGEADLSRYWVSEKFDGVRAYWDGKNFYSRNNLIFVDDFPLDKVVHFDQTIGEEDDIAGGGRFSIFAPNSVAGAEFSPGGWGAAYGGRAGSLLRLELAEGGLTPVTSLRLDIAGAEFTYDGPSGIDDDTSVFFTARRFDFGNVFELIGEEDIGTPKVTDIILKTTTQLTDRDELQFLVIHAPAP